jgi:hypothetical protein
VGVTKDGPPLVIDHMITYQLIAMDGFWAAAPPGVLDDLLPLARECSAKALKIAMGEGCTGCSSLKTAVQPIHTALWGRVAKAVELGVGADGLVDFIAAKRGYRPRPVEVYYKDEAGFQHRLTL